MAGMHQQGTGSQGNCGLRRLTILQAVYAGDAEGANEMSYSMGFLRQFCRIFQDQAGSTRIFFPDDKVRHLLHPLRGFRPILHHAYPFPGQCCP